MNAVSQPPIDEQVLNAAIAGALLEEIEEGAYVVDRQRRILRWNAAAERITGYLCQEVAGRFCDGDLLMHCDGSGQHLCQSGCILTAAMADGQHHESDIFLRHKNGHRVPVHVRARPCRDLQGRIIGVVQVFAEQGAAVRARYSALNAHGLLDETTYAASRQYGEFRANQRLAELKALGIPLGWLQIVLDDAEALEHRYGHGVIDAAIAVASATLGRNIGSMDLLIRWDRTAFRLCVNSCTAAELQQLAGKLVALVRNSNVAWWGDPLPIAISIGGTIARPADQLSSLEARAKGALEHSRSAGGNQATIADSSGGTSFFRIL